MLYTFIQEPRLFFAMAGTLFSAIEATSAWLQSPMHLPAQNYYMAKINEFNHCSK